jgi:hypothetical protein
METLFWWTKEASVVPLISTNPDPNTIGALNENGTSVLYGGSGNPVRYGTIPGIRGTLGAWLVDGVGIEGNIFGLPKQGKTTTVQGAGGDNPVVAVPFNSTVPFNGQDAGESSFNNGNIPSQIQVTTTTQLWGAEALGLGTICRSGPFYAAMVGGFQYLELKESLNLSQIYESTITPGLLSIDDRFTSRNQFYGAVVGLRTGVMMGPVGLSLTGKVGFGPNAEKYTVLGSTSVTGTAFGLPGGVFLPPGTTPGGTFAQPSNSGTFNRNQFIAVPQVQAKLWFDVFRSTRVFVGYDFLYLSDVVRASTQIDRNINPTQNVVFGPAIGPTTGLLGPIPTFNRTDFWAQGISGGIQIQY